MTVFESRSIRGGFSAANRHLNPDRLWGIIHAVDF